MANLPFPFLGIPTFILDSDWLDPLDDAYAKRMRFLIWALRECTNFLREELFQAKLLTLQPYEFIYQSNLSAVEMGNSRQECRTMIDQLLSLGFIEQTKNTHPNKFSCYRFVVELMSKKTFSNSQKGINQHINQPSNQLSNQLNNQPKSSSKHCHKQENEKRQPTHQPTEQPTEQPTGQPTEGFSSIYTIERKTVDRRCKINVNAESLSPSTHEEGEVVPLQGPLDSPAESTDPEVFADNLEKIKDYNFPSGKKILDRSISRWLSLYETFEILEAIKYYEHMRKNKPIPKPEAYIETTLKYRHWDDFNKKKQQGEQ